MMPSQTSVAARERVRAIMSKLSDELLLEAYESAIILRLDREFILLLFAEINRRKLPIFEEQLA